MLPLLCLLAVFAFSAPPVSAQAIFVVNASVTQSTNTVSAKPVHSTGTGCTFAGNTWSYDWGDGDSTTFTTNWTLARSHTYEEFGKYTITLSYECDEHTETQTATATITIDALSPSWAVEAGTQTPNYFENAQGGFIGLKVSSNKNNTSAVCSIPSTGESGTCAPDTFVTLPAPTVCGPVRVRAVATRGSETATLWGTATVTTSVTRPCTPPTPAPDSKDDSSGSGSGSQRRVEPTPTRDPANLPIPTQDHSQLPDGAVIASESPWIHFREIEVGHLGEQWVIDAGARTAIDIWSPLPLAAEVCFAGVGSLLLLDAAFSPRLPTPMESYLRAGKTCSQLDRAGTMVLMPGQPSIMPTSPPTATPAPAPTANPYLIADPLDSQRTLADCMVRSDLVLNFRDGPAGRIVSWYAGSSEALSRTRNWFQVSYLGEEGWISAHYVTTSGDCG